MDFTKFLNQKVKENNTLDKDQVLEEVIQKVKLLQDIKDDSKNEVLEIFFDIVLDEIREFIGFDIALEKISQSLLVKMLNFKHSRQGTETLASYNYSGVSETFLEGYPEDIKQSLESLKKINKKARFI